MNEKNLGGDNGGMEKRSGELLKQELQENARRLAMLVQNQARATAELNRVEQELQELSTLYPGSRRKRLG